jgi:hypothetical protein
MKFTCPKCGSHLFGSMTKKDGTLERSCHGDEGSNYCGFTFPASDDAKYFTTAQDLVQLGHRTAVAHSSRDRLRVEVDMHGKYTVVQDETGRVRVLRYGEEWRDATGDGVILALAQNVERQDKRIAELRGVIDFMLGWVAEGGKPVAADLVRNRISAIHGVLARTDGPHS